MLKTLEVEFDTLFPEKEIIKMTIYLVQRSAQVNSPEFEDVNDAVMTATYIYDITREYVEVETLSGEFVVSFGRK